MKILNLAIHDDKFFAKIFLDFKLLKTSCIFQETREKSTHINTQKKHTYNLQNITCQNQNSFCLKIAIFCYVKHLKSANCVYKFLQISQILVDFAKSNKREIFF